METGRGPRSDPRASQYSSKTQDLLRLMMQESRLTHLQRKQINESLRSGAALPQTSDPTSAVSASKPKPSTCVAKQLPSRPQRRSAESCRSGNSYVREKFCPGPTRDLEKEKRRLQYIMATGQEEPRVASHKKVPASQKPEVAEETDQFQEVLNAIEERRQFLADMASLGQEKQYANIINTEISQKIRELEILDKTKNHKRKAATSEKKEDQGAKLKTGNSDVNKTEAERPDCK